jgi:hypothetical protein
MSYQILVYILRTQNYPLDSVLEFIVKSSFSFLDHIIINLCIYLNYEFIIDHLPFPLLLSDFNHHLLLLHLLFLNFISLNLSNSLFIYF